MAKTSSDDHLDIRTGTSLVWEGVGGWKEPVTSLPGKLAARMSGGGGPPSCHQNNNSVNDSALNSLEYWDYSVELECLTGPEDLQLAAELGKTLLERNRELEASIKHHQAVIEDQSQEIEYLTKQTSALREVNESRVKVYEQLEISLQEAEQLNGRLLSETNSDKARIKSLSGIVDNLEQKCEELQELLKFQNLNKQDSSQDAAKGKKSRKKSSICGGYRKTSSASQLHGCHGDELVEDDVHDSDDDGGGGEGEHSYTYMHSMSPSFKHSLQDEAFSRLEGTSSSLSNGNSSSSGFYSSASCKEQEICRLELEVVQLTSDGDRMQEQTIEDAKRIKELEQQVVALLCENNSLGCEAAGNRGCTHLLTQLEAEIHEVSPPGDHDGGFDGGCSGSGSPGERDALLINRRNRGRNCLCSEVLKADCVQLMSRVRAQPFPNNKDPLSTIAKHNQPSEDNKSACNPSAEKSLSRDKSADKSLSRDRSADKSLSRDRSADKKPDQLAEQYKSSDQSANKSLSRDQSADQAQSRDQSADSCKRSAETEIEDNMVVAPSLKAERLEGDKVTRFESDQVTRSQSDQVTRLKGDNDQTFCLDSLILVLLYTLRMHSLARPSPPWLDTFLSTVGIGTFIIALLRTLFFW